MVSKVVASVPRYFYNCSTRAHHHARLGIEATQIVDTRHLVTVVAPPLDLNAIDVPNAALSPPPTHSKYYVVHHNLTIWMESKERAGCERK